MGTFKEGVHRGPAQRLEGLVPLTSEASLLITLGFSLQLQRSVVGDSDVPLEFDYRDWSRKNRLLPFTLLVDLPSFMGVPSPESPPASFSTSETPVA